MRSWLLVALQMLGVVFLLPQDECRLQSVEQEASPEERGNSLPQVGPSDTSPSRAHAFGPFINDVGSQQSLNVQDAGDFSMRDPRFDIAGRDISIYRNSRKNDIAYVQRVARWLSSTDAKRIHADTLAKRSPGTGVWLVEGDQFTRWSLGERKVLWVTGMPGSGKTVLASIATDHIEQTICAFSQGKHVVVFFQCQYKTPVSPSHILSTFLRQLLEEDNEGVFEVIDPIYSEWATKSTPLSEAQTVDLLGKILDLFQKVYIVVDALDELKETDNFIRSLSNKIFKSPNTFITQHCIAYLSGPASPSTRTPSAQSLALEPRPISVDDDDTDWKCQDGREIAFPYAYSNWGVHAKQALTEDSGIASTVAAFVLDCNDYICNISSASSWQNAFRSTTEIIQPIHLIALHGLSKILPSTMWLWRQRTSSGSTPLHLAAYKGHEDIVQVIFEAAPSWVNDVDDYGYTPFMLACQQGHDDIVKLFLSCPDTINLNARNTTHNSTPLILATIGGHAPVVKLLVCPRKKVSERLDVDLHAQDKQGKTALMFACALGFQEIVEILTERSDLNINQSRAFGHTAFTEAAIHGSVPIFRILLAHSSRFFLRTPATALIHASRFGREAMVEYLLSLRDVNPNVRCEAGNTPLMTAAAEGNERICGLLLKHPDIDVNAQNGTAVAVRHRGTNPRMDKTGTGTTALMMACMGGHRSVVDLLLDQEDINVDVKDHTGKTALQLVRREGRHGKDIMTSLLHASKPTGKMRTAAHLPEERRDSITLEGAITNDIQQIIDTLGDSDDEDVSTTSTQVNKDSRTNLRM
ncbi:hypothetical protein H1R20_g14847, partial [Candolleomyces eurysporus]